MPKKLFFILSIFIPVIVLDQITKLITYHNMAYQESIPIIPGFFSLTYVRNYGAAWGFLSGISPAIRTPLFWTISICAIIGISYYLYKIEYQKKLMLITLTLILSGATGNFLDRLCVFHPGGYVIDFLDFYIKTWHWPAFNVADMSISSAIGLLAFITFKEDIISKKRSNK